MAKLKLPFELEKPSNNEYVTQASQIGHNGVPVSNLLAQIGKLLVDDANIVASILGKQFLLIEDRDAQPSTDTSAVCGRALCGYAICGTN